MFVNKNNYSTTYFSSTQSINDTDIVYGTTGNKTQLSVTYDSGVGAIIDVFESQLTIQVTSSTSYVNRTLGLLGVNNNDINDDFTRPDGSIIPINSTQEQIYYQFGKLCESHLEFCFNSLSLPLTLFLLKTKLFIKFHVCLLSVLDKGVTISIVYKTTFLE